MYSRSGEQSLDLESRQQGNAWLLTTNYPPVSGGVSRYNSGLVSAARGRIQVAGIGSFSPPPKGQNLAARVREVFWAFRVARRVSPSDEILASPPHLGVGVLLAGRRPIQFIHGGEWQDTFLGGFFLQKFLHRTKLIVVSSEATKQRWVAPYLQKRTMVLRPGLSRITPIARRLERTRSKGRPFQILSVARLSPRKGFDRLIEAVLELHHDGIEVDLKIVGSGPMESRLRAKANNSSVISFHTSVSDEELREFYDSADLFALLPQQIRGGEAWEGFGIVYLEAAARGLPILASKSGGVPEAVCRRGSEMLDELCTPGEIANAIRELRVSPSRLFRMSLANIDWAAANLWENRQDTIQRMLVPSGQLDMS